MMMMDMATDAALEGKEKEKERPARCDDPNAFVPGNIYLSLLERGMEQEDFAAALVTLGLVQCSREDVMQMIDGQKEISEKDLRTFAQWLGKTKLELRKGDVPRLLSRGEALELWREEHGLTRAKVAKMIGVTANTIKSWETTERISGMMVAKVMQGLQVDLDTICNRWYPEK